MKSLRHYWIVPTDDLTAIRICDSVEKFREKHPRLYGKVMETRLMSPEKAKKVDNEDV